MSDTASAPDPLERSLIESAVGRAASASGASLRRAWDDSRLRRLRDGLAGEYRLATPTVRIRLVAIVFAIAMITDRAMSLLSPRPADPLASALPLGVLVVSVVAAYFSGALARSAGRLRR